MNSGTSVIFTGLTHTAGVVYRRLEDGRAGWRWSDRRRGVLIRRRRGGRVKEGMQLEAAEGIEEAYVGLGVRNVETTPAFRSQVAAGRANHSYYRT